MIVKCVDLNIKQKRLQFELEPFLNLIIDNRIEVLFYSQICICFHTSNIKYFGKKRTSLLLNFNIFQI